MDKVKAYYKSASGQLQPVKPYLYRPATGGGERGVQAEDVLGVGIWAALPNTLTYSYENAVPITLLTFTDGTEIYTLYNELMEEPYTIDFAVYHGEQYANPIASLAFNEGYSPPASWNASSYNFGGRTVQAINDVSIQNVIKVQDGTPAITAPLTAYFAQKIEEIQPIYGVSGLYQSSPALTRTDDAVGLSFAINSSSGAISSDFNDVFPWNEATVEEISGNKFVHMPEMWFRIGYDSSKRITDVAVSKQASGAGNWYKVESFYYSCYGGSVSSGKLSSVSGVTRQGSATRARFRTYAAANGSGYFQRDLYHSTVMSFLWWIEWATKDSSSIMTGRISGSGTSGGATLRPTGGTNSVSTPSGFETAYAQMRYHYIEDFIGNMIEFVDGSVGSSNNYFVTATPTAYSDTTTGHTNLPYNYPANASSTNRCISAFGWDADNPFLCQPIEQIGTDYTVHFCDANTLANNVVLYCGAYYNDASATYGLSYFTRYTVSGSFSFIGGRLLYKPTGE